MSQAVEHIASQRQGGWYLQRSGAVVLLARRVPVRFDLAVRVVLDGIGAGGSRAALAHQVRQDIWRCLRDLRCFWPVVRIERSEDALLVTAGGALDGGSAAQHRAGIQRAEALLHDLMTDAARQKRWLRHAGFGRVAPNVPELAS